MTELDIIVTAKIAARAITGSFELSELLGASAAAELKTDKLKQIADTAAAAINREIFL